MYSTDQTQETRLLSCKENTAPTRQHYSHELHLSALNNPYHQVGIDYLPGNHQRLASMRDR